MSTRPVAFVTGASRGIGRAIALGLAAAEYDIAGNSRLGDPKSRSAIAELQAWVEERGGAFLAVPGDMSNLDRHQSMIDSILAKFGRLDLLVNNAGIAPEKRVDVLETSSDSFDQVLGTNLRGPFFLTQRVARAMIEQNRIDAGRRSKIIFITSVSAYISSPSRTEYCISKCGLSMAAAIFADRLATHLIDVYEVRPGVIKTDMTAPVSERYDKLIAEGLVPQSRWGLPEDVAKAVVALACGSFDYSTGLVVEVSGGMNIRRL